MKTFYDTPDKIDFFATYSQAKSKMQEIVDMPDRYIDRLTKAVMEHNGTLSSTQRTSHFSMLTDAEVKALEAVVVEYLMPFKR